MSRPRWFALLSLVLVPRLTAQPAPADRGVIDMHLHAYAKDPRWQARIGNPVTGQKMVATDENGHREATLAALRRNQVVRAAVSGDWEAVLRWRDAEPALVIAGYAFDDPGTLDLAFLRREHAAGRLQLLGEGGPQYAGIAPDDPRLEPVYALAEELDVPLALHLHPGPPGATAMGMAKMRPSLGDPLRLEEVLVRHPKLRLYVMHAGWPMLDRMMALLWSFPQVYVDIAALDWALTPQELERYLGTLVRAGFGRRILFGSDQMVWPETIDLAVAAIRSANYLTAEQKSDILYHNAARFLRLEPSLPMAPEGAMETLPR